MAQLMVSMYKANKQGICPRKSPTTAFSILLVFSIFVSFWGIKLRPYTC